MGTRVPCFEAHTGIAFNQVQPRRTSMSSRKVTRQWNRRATSAGSLRIMPGAFSRASHSVTRNSAASWRVLSSSCSASAICADHHSP